MAQIKVSGLSFTYPGSYIEVFRNVSFQIDTDWKLGFVGRNGRGKTTFLHLLMGKYPYQGTIESPLGFEYFPYHVTDEHLTALEVAHTIVSGLEEWRLLRELNKMEVDPEVLEREFATLSEGEKTKVLLTVLFLKEHSYLLIDEPTNHLDLKSREIVARYLNAKNGFILVSHDRRFLDNCVDHILAINRADIEIQKGNFSSWYLNRKNRDEFEARENERLRRDIDRLRDAKAMMGKWSNITEKSKIGCERDKGYIGHKAAKMMKRSKTAEARMEKAIAEKAGLLKNIEAIEALKIHPLKHHSRLLIDCHDLRMYRGDKQVGPTLSLSVERGERIAVTGKNGSGKSTLLKLIAGLDIRYDGYFRRASNLIISYVPQSAAGLSGNLDDYARSCRIDMSLFKTILDKFDFSRDLFAQDMERYSSGQKKKVLIARSLCEQAHLYIWDEPLNYIDVFSRIQIEKLLADAEATLVFVEHDTEFVDKIATKKINLP
ncbi:MAG TPA: ABC-F type ribosomal protection protein [Acholeplasmataceae bacterium]|nr:ABC-F type ribosomal protection protein [Acholeplasmataceae bacterium]